MRTFSIFILAAIVAVVGAGQAKADIQAYSTSDSVGNQAWGGNLGLDFNVNSAISISALGAFDSSGLAFSPGITVGLFERLPGTPDPSSDHQGTLITSVTITSNGFLSGNYRFVDLSTHLVLNPGYYDITAVGFNGTNLNLNENFHDGSLINTNDGSGLISMVGSGRFDGNGSLDYSTYTTDQLGYSVSSHVFGGGSFLYEKAPTVPEPSTFALLGLGGLGLAYGAYQRRRNGSRPE